jgi:LysM repeat protein
MDDEKRKNARAIIALAGIGAFCAVAIFVAVAILFLRADARNPDMAVAVPVTVNGQTVYIYPDPAMSVKVVSEQPDSSSGEVDPVPIVTLPADAIAQATAQVGTGGQTQPPTSTPLPPSVVVINYTVVPGDSLYRITQKHNTSIDLMASYGIAAADMIAGNSLLLPVANQAFCPGSRPHVVRDQQTVSEIARAYNTTPQAIAAANGLDASYSVKTTQVLCVPY